MSVLRRLPIPLKITLLGVTVCTFVLLATSSAFFLFDVYSFRKEIRHETVTLARIVAFNCRAALTFRDPDTAQRILTSLSENEDVLAAAVYDSKGQRFASYRQAVGADPTPDCLQTKVSIVQAGHTLRCSEPVTLDQEVIGAVLIESAMLRCRTRLARFAAVVFVIMAFAIAASFVVTLRLQRLVSSPIQNLAAVARRVAGAADYTLRASRESADEIGDLVGSFNAMLDQIKVRDDSLLRQAQELREHQERLRLLASELLLTEERERRRIATAVHDSLSQLLVISKLKLDMANRGAEADLKTAVASVSDLLREAIEHSRALTFELSPPVLCELGLSPALQDLAERMTKRYGLRIVYEPQSAQLAIKDDTAVLLYRAVQELLTNAVKHAHAKLARIRVHTADNLIQIDVSDDGEGFAPHAIGHAGEGGFGLFSIRERLLHLGGNVEVDSRPGQGTRIRLTIALPHPL